MTSGSQDNEKTGRPESKAARKRGGKRPAGPQTAPAEIVLTPAQFLEAMVLPTFDEFLADTSNPRRAYLACLVAAHLVDQITRSEKLHKDVVKARIAEGGDFRREALEIVEGIANGTKHAGTGRGEPFPFAPGHEEYAPELILGAPGSDFAKMGFNRRAGLIVRHHGRSFFIDDCVRLVIGAFRAAYPARFTAAEPF